MREFCFIFLFIRRKIPIAGRGAQIFLSLDCQVKRNSPNPQARELIVNFQA